METHTEKIYFVSHSKEKFEEINKINKLLETEVAEIQRLPNIILEQYEMDIPELQTEYVDELIKKKALEAFKTLHRPLLVEHTALKIHAFNELPGMQTRHFYTKMGYKSIVDYCNYKKDFGAVAESIFCYCDGRQFLIERAEDKGEIKKDIEEISDCFDWDKIFCPFDQNPENKTYAEMGEQKNKRSMRRKAYENLRKNSKFKLYKPSSGLSNDDKIKKLAGLVKERKVLLFLGAGISASIGFPSWNKLIKEMGEKEGFDGELFGLYGNNMMLAEYAYGKNENSTYGFLRKTLDIKDKADLTTKLDDSFIYNAIYELNFPVIYTTNYDHLLEEYYDRKKHRYSKVVNIEDMRNVNFSNSDNTRIMKFHGDIDDKESIVLSEKKYFGRMDFQSFMDIQFQSDILQYHVLYLGYSLSDINIKLMLYLAGKRWENSEEVNESYIFTATPNEIQEEVFEKNGIVTILGEGTDKKKGTETFLDKLLEYIKEPCIK